MNSQLYLLRCARANLLLGASSSGSQLRMAGEMTKTRISQGGVGAGWQRQGFFPQEYRSVVWLTPRARECQRLIGHDN